MIGTQISIYKTQINKIYTQNNTFITAIDPYHLTIYILHLSTGVYKHARIMYSKLRLALVNKITKIHEANNTTMIDV